MSSIPEPSKSRYPFGFSRQAYVRALEIVPARDILADIDTGRENRAVRDLLAEYEAVCWMVLDSEDDLGDSNAIARMMADRLAAKIHELARRRQLLDRFPGHPYAPSWPAKDEGRRRRVESVKAAISVESFVRDHLNVELRLSGDHLVGRCPFPGHDDRTPSFHVHPDRAWCFGCNRGGDLIDVAKAYLNTTDFRQALDSLERIGGFGKRGVS